MMIIHAAKPLFAWDCLEDSPSLQTIKELLAALPDGKLLDSLRTRPRQGTQRLPGRMCSGASSSCGSPCGTSPPRPCSPNSAATTGLRRAHRHRVGGRRAQALEHLAVRGRARPGAASHALERDLQCVDPTPGRRGRRPGPRHRRRRHRRCRRGASRRRPRRRRSTRACRRPAAAARSTRTTRAR